MPVSANSSNIRSRILRVFAVAIAAMAITLAFTAATPQRAYAYSTTAMKGAVGKVTGKQHNNTYYGNSPEDVMAAVEHMTSFWNITSHEEELTIDLFTDWNTKGYGRIKVPNGYTYHINLHGHMIDRGKALSYGDNKWYAEGSGEVIYVDGGTLYLNGGTGTDADAHMHTGSYYDNFWKYTEGGWEQFSMYGGLITGGACDDWHGAGGISLARDTSRAFITNTTIAGNLTDQYNGRYGHGAGIAVHGSKCTLELNNVKVTNNRAEGYGGGIYVRNTDCALTIKNSWVESNYCAHDGGGIYLDSKATLNVDNSSISKNISENHGGGIYVNAKGSVLNLNSTGDSYVTIAENYARNGGGGIYTDGSDTTVNLTRVKLTHNKVDNPKTSELRDGGGLYVDGNSSTVNIVDSSVEGNWVTHGRGGGIYFYGNDGTLNVTNSLVNRNRVWNYNSKTTSDAGRGGGIYHDGKRGKVTFKDSQLNWNEAYFNGGGLYNWYAGTEYEFINSSIEGNSAYGDGAGVFVGAKATLTLDKTNIKGNNAATKPESASDIDSVGGGAGVYNKADGTKIILKNGSSICENKLQNKISTKQSGGAGVYSTDTLTIVSEDGTGSIKDNTAEIGNGGGIWFKGALYLDNIAITGNVTPGTGGGIYCTNTEYRAFELARKITISGNQTSTKKDSNLYLRKNQNVCSADGDRKLSVDSKIAVDAEDFTGTSARRVSGNQLLLKALGEKYTSVFSSDNHLHSISSDGNYVYLDPQQSGKYAVTVKIGATTEELKAQDDGSTVALKSSDWLTFDESWCSDDGYLYRSKFSTIDYWTVTDAFGERVVTVKDGEASFALRGSDATAVPHVLAKIGAIGVQIKETASWDSLDNLSENTASIELVNYRERRWTYYYHSHGDWAKDHSKTYEEHLHDEGGDYTETVYEWWDYDPTQGTQLIPKASIDYPSANYNYSFDHLSRGDAAQAVATVKRTNVQDVTKDGVVTGKEVTYEVTIKKSLFEGENLQASDRLMEFEGQASGTDENGLGSQTVSDQNVKRWDPNHITNACTSGADSEGNQVVTFKVTYPKTRAIVTFDAKGGSLPEGAASKVTVGTDKKLSTLPVPTREGYVFEGWYTADAQGEATETKVDTSTTFDSDTTIVAKWTEKDKGEQTVRYRMVVYMSQEGDSEADLCTVDVGLAVFADEAATTAQIAKPADPVREGYTFGGWFTSEACTEGSEFTFDDHNMGTVEYGDDDLELYAKWEKNSVPDHTVTFKDGDTTCATLTVKDGGTWEKLIPKSPTKEGYEFTGWTLEDGESCGPKKPVTSDLTLVANWKVPSYTVTYKTPDDTSADTPAEASLISLMSLAADDSADDQDDSSGTVVAEVEVEKGKTAPELEPTREGYRFAGWFVDGACTEAYDFETRTVTENTILYAKWVKTATITFDTAGGEEVASLTVDAGSTVESSDLPIAVRDNYRFHGWLTGSADGTAVSSEFEVEDDMTLYAHWVGDTVFVYLHGIYSDNEISYDMKHYGDVLTGIEVNVDHADPVREGYTFGGWFTDEECTERYEFDRDPLTDDIDLYAKWVPESCTVVFDSQGGSDVGGTTLVGGDLVDEPEAPSRDGYVFKGWFTDAACTETWDFSAPVTKSMTLYAGWAEAVTVTLDAAGGDLPLEYPALTVEKGAPVGNLPVPRRGATGEDSASAEDAYVFLGWYTKDGQKVDADTKFDSDVSLIARWKTNEGSDADDSGSDTDADTNGSGKKGNLPRTGDDSLLAIGAVLAAGCVLVLVGVIVKRRQR